MANVSEKKYCFGCGACSAICPKKCISMHLNKDGFYTPYIDDSKCVNCSLCQSVCPQNEKEILFLENRVNISYSGYSKNPEIRYKCSSGGVVFSILQNYLENGYKVCAVKYNKNAARAEHYIAENEEELLASMGSKYIPSYTETAFSQFKRDDKYVIVGSPCQIDGIRRVLRKRKMEKNCIFIDFFCHGVPSMNMWKKYLFHIGYKADEDGQICWRDKKTGWHDSWAMTYNKAQGSTVRSRWKDKDLFYEMFLGDYCFNLSCHKDCKFKGFNSSADIRAGDLWGNKYEDDELGTSGIIAITEQGNQLVTSIRGIELTKEDNDTILAAQLKSNPKRKLSAYFCKWALRLRITLKLIYKIARFIDFSQSIPERISNRIKRFLRR